MPLFSRGQKVGSGQDADRWLVLRKLGEGQFAEVYEMRDTFVKDRELRVRHVFQSQDFESCRPITLYSD